MSKGKKNPFTSNTDKEENIDGSCEEVCSNAWSIDHLQQITSGTRENQDAKSSPQTY